MSLGLTLVSILALLMGVFGIVVVGLFWHNDEPRERKPVRRQTTADVVRIGEWKAR